MFKLLRHRPMRSGSSSLLAIGPACLLTLLLAAALCPEVVFAHGALVFPFSLKNVRPPPIPGLGKVVKNEKALLVLGKALFWDMNVGSDGMACASCHFHAGADVRTKNALNPGGKRHLTDAGGNPLYPGLAAGFKPTASGGAGGPNYELTANDFPFVRLADPNDADSGFTAETDNVMSSSGTYAGEFRAVHRTGDALDDCDRAGHDGVYHVGGIRTRQVEPRNTPTVINAALFHRQFWDGRANSVFNGVNGDGLRDSGAGVWVVVNGKPKKKPFRLENSSLASQAVGPPVNNQEMSCNGRTFPDVGRKLLQRRALERQEVHAEDSVLAGYRSERGQGLAQTYAELIKKAFRSAYWSGKAPPKNRAIFGKPAGSAEPYTLMEANFALYFGVAVQAYMRTLISDQAPVDSDKVRVCFDGHELQPVTGCPNSDYLIDAPQAMTAAQLRGLQHFINAHCIICHTGPLASTAVSPEIVRLVNGKAVKVNPDGYTLVDRTNDPLGNTRLMDVGFVNTGVTHYSFDPGLGNNSASNPSQPLSFAQQYLAELVGNGGGVFDELKVRPCLFTVPFVKKSKSDPYGFPDDQLQPDPLGSEGCVLSKLAMIPTPAAAAAEVAKAEAGSSSLLRAGVQGTFKIPTLRNVELTAPYFHNGSVLTLNQVIDFYIRVGNYASRDKAVEMPTLSDIIGNEQGPKDDIIAFLKSLTDERVRDEAAPFDHPALRVPNGHAGDHRSVSDADGDGLADDEFLEIPAVGRKGRTGQGLGPIQALQGSIEGSEGTH
ncbi:cytochrome-c peroxidase [Methylococcus capsulatus]|uniref:cytochrome-c peroxidase n=1 Tax=Methylococcus capsulatus TaxID=414 RepID=UPI001C5285C1|nr:cytochrome c peroxidase [Methylococcus capsulatus]QXP86854.1 cytochrome C peroxidase [Methylococcus capsulatus]QXP93468.1 cytochrome C peroxidase [Methylococcus capsulatus]